MKKDTGLDNLCYNDASPEATVLITKIEQLEAELAQNVQQILTKYVYNKLHTKQIFIEKYLIKNGFGAGIVRINDVGTNVVRSNVGQNICLD